MIYRDGKKVEDSADSMEPGDVSGDNDEDAPAEDAEEAEDSGSKTGLISKSIVGGAGDNIKAGDEIRFRVVHTYDDEIEIRYAHDKDKKDQEEGMEEIAADA